MVKKYRARDRRSGELEGETTAGNGIGRMEEAVGGGGKVTLRSYRGGRRGEERW